MDLTKTSEIIIYQSEDNQTQIEVRLEEETIWLTQDQMANLFMKDRTVITRHIGNIFKEKELDDKSNVQKMHFPNSDKPTKLYNLWKYNCNKHYSFIITIGIIIN